MLSNILLFVYLTHGQSPILPAYLVFVLGFFIRLSTSIGSNLTRAITMFTNILVGCKRIEKLLLEEEISSSNRIVHADENLSNVAIQIKNYSNCRKNLALKSESFTLKKIDLEIKRGMKNLLNLR